MNEHLQVSRRQFLRSSLAGAAGAVVLPTIVPASVFGQDAPSNKIQIGQIGCGRIGHDMDMPGILKHDRARIVALCDLDSKRLQHAKAYVEGAYAKKKGSVNAVVFIEHEYMSRHRQGKAVRVAAWRRRSCKTGTARGQLLRRRPVSARDRQRRRPAPATMTWAGENS
jgi:hypothetical protein